MNTGDNGKLKLIVAPLNFLSQVARTSSHRQHTDRGRPSFTVPSWSRQVTSSILRVLSLSNMEKRPFVPDNYQRDKKYFY